MDSSPSLSGRDLRVTFGPITALDGVELDVEGPEIVGVAGPNGSGKTTLIHCLLGLQRPTAGETYVCGVPSGDFDASDRERLGYMPQHTAVYDDLTVRENVAFFARLYGVADRASAVEDALAVVDLGDRSDARIGELSGGMVRRTSLACTLVHDPDILFLDEPTVGLDPKLRASMWAEFRERRDDGALVVVSTHYLGEVTNCDRVLLLRDGRVLVFDAPGAFLDATGAPDMEAAFLSLLDEGGDTGDGGRVDGAAAAGGGE